MTLAPSATSMRAVPAPRPEAAPVTINILFLISIMCLACMKVKNGHWARCAISGLQRLEDALFDLVDRAQPRELPVGRGSRAVRLCPLRIVVDQGARLITIDREPMAHGFFFVVVTLYQGFAGDIVNAGLLGWIELGVIAASAGGVHAATAHALDDVFFGHHDFHHVVQAYARVLERIGLRNRTGKAVEQVAVAAVGLLQAI